MPVLTGIPGYQETMKYSAVHLPCALATTLLLWMLQPRVIAQEPPAEANAKFSAAVSVVSVLASVRDKQGQIVTNLTQNDFALSEQGRLQTVQFFPRAEVPPTVILE